MKKKCPRWKPATDRQKEIAAIGLDWLLHEKLSVTLIDAPEPMHRGHKIRVADQNNPAWYRRMWHSRWNGLKHGKSNCGGMRKRVLKALRRVVGGWVDPQGYEDEALSEIKADLIDQGWEPEFGDS